MKEIKMFQCEGCGCLYDKEKDAMSCEGDADFFKKHRKSGVDFSHILVKNQKIYTLTRLKGEIHRKESTNERN